MDDSTYDSSQSDMIVFTNPAANINDQPVTYGPVLYDVLADLAGKIGGAQYLIGKSRLLIDLLVTEVTIRSLAQIVHYEQRTTNSQHS